MTTMSTLEQPALPFYENSDVEDIQYPWMSFDEMADRVFPIDDKSFNDMKALNEAVPTGHEMNMTQEEYNETFSQKMLALSVRAHQVSNKSANSDSEKYHAVRYSLALRIIDTYVKTGHFHDATYELDKIRDEIRPLIDQNGDPYEGFEAAASLVGFIQSSINSMRQIHPKHSEPAKEVSYVYISSLFDE
ncbi:MAG: hypothetical protein JWN75_30 [Candidatus Saccharibacteria bacterium]|nr:hypothetical protein [Candidatus Saccharibacteria bacterium]